MAYLTRHQKRAATGNAGDSSRASRDANKDAASKPTPKARNAAVKKSAVASRKPASDAKDSSDTAIAPVDVPHPRLGVHAAIAAKLAECDAMLRRIRAGEQEVGDEEMMRFLDKNVDFKLYSYERIADYLEHEGNLGDYGPLAGTGLTDEDRAAMVLGHLGQMPIRDFWLLARRAQPHFNPALLVTNLVVPHPDVSPVFARKAWDVVHGGLYMLTELFLDPEKLVWAGFDGDAQAWFTSLTPNARAILEGRYGGDGRLNADMRRSLFKAWVWKILVDEFFTSPEGDGVRWTEPYRFAGPLATQLERLRADAEKRGSNSHRRFHVWRVLTSWLLREDRPHYMEEMRRIDPDCMRECLERRVGRFLSETVVDLGPELPDDQVPTLRPTMQDFCDRVARVEYVMHQGTVEWEFSWTLAGQKRGFRFGASPSPRNGFYRPLLQRDCHDDDDLMDEEGKEDLDLVVEFVVCPSLSIRGSEQYLYDMNGYRTTPLHVCTVPRDAYVGPAVELPDVWETRLIQVSGKEDWTLMAPVKDPKMKDKYMLE